MPDPPAIRRSWTFEFPVSLGYGTTAYAYHTIRHATAEEAQRFVQQRLDAVAGAGVLRAVRDGERAFHFRIANRADIATIGRRLAERRRHGPEREDH